MTLYDLPALNASLNATAAVLLVLGFILAKQGRRTAHRNVMIAAVAISTVFLVSYLTYHAQVGTTRFAGAGWSRPVYFSILTTHTILAAAVPFLVVAAIWRAAKGQIDRHRRIVRWAWPAWLYVSVTGVLVYLFLYQWFPSR